jgi:hypothetical protein
MRDKLETCSQSDNSNKQSDDYFQAYTPFRPAEAKSNDVLGHFTADTIIEIKDREGQLVAASESIAGYRHH